MLKVRDRHSQSTPTVRVITDVDSLFVVRIKSTFFFGNSLKKKEEKSGYNQVNAIKI